MEQQPGSGSERFKSKLKAFGRGALEFAGRIAEAIEEHQNELVPCQRCETQVPRRKLFWSFDSRFSHAPLGFEKPYQCCPLCVEASKQELERLLRNRKHLREYQRVFDQCVRAREKNLPATLTGKQWIAILDHHNWRCAYCRLAPFTDLEHVVPIARGGGTTAENCVPACESCNSKKGARHPRDIVQMGEAIQRINSGSLRFQNRPAACANAIEATQSHRRQMRGRRIRSACQGRR